MPQHINDGDEIIDIAEDHPPSSGSEDEGGENQNEQAADVDDEDLLDSSIHCFSGHAGPVYAVAWNPQRKDVVASGGGDDKAFLWKTGTENLEDIGSGTAELLGHTDTVACLQFSNDGTLLATGGLDGQVLIWSCDSARCLHSLNGLTDGIEWLSWHPKGNLLVAGSEDLQICMWNAAIGVLMQTFSGHGGAVRCGQFTPDGNRVVSGGGEGDESLKVWDPKTNACLLTVQDAHNYHNAGLTVMAVHSDSSTVCTGSEDATARLVNIRSGRVLGTLSGHNDSVEAVAFVENLRLVVTASVDGDMRIWDVSTLTVRAACQHPEAVIQLLCHPMEPIAYTGCLDGCVRSWNLRTGECIRTKHGHSEGIQAMAVCPANGSLILTGSDDNTARIFDFHWS